MKVLARRWFAVVITVIAGGALGLLLSMQLAPTYKASAKVFLSTASLAAGGSTVDLSRAVQTHAELASSTQAVRDIAGKLLVTPGYVADRLAAEPAEEGYFFTITGTDDTQAKAVQLVAAAEEVYRASAADYGSVDAANLQQLIKTRDDFQTELTRLQADPDPTPAMLAQAEIRGRQVQSLNNQIADAEVQQKTGSSTITLAEPPKEDGQVAPNLFMNVLVGALFGLFASAAVIWIRYLRRPTVLDGRSAADALGAPLIAGPSADRVDDELTTETLVSAMAAVLSPTVKVVALTPAGSGDLQAETIAAVAASWSDDQGVVLVLDASPTSDVRSTLERLPRATSGELPRWAHDPTCLARSSGSGRGHVLYNRVSPSRAARPGGLAPILADRAPVVDLVILLTPPLRDLPMTAASALQADAVVVITSPETRVNELAQVCRDWPALAERIVGVVHDRRSGFRRTAVDGSRSSRAGSASASAQPPVVVGGDDHRGADPEATDRYVRPSKF
jgi:capsular polysaccharide biosynthesis protein